jgi:photosystem II stability/assembly factor-like uncharacterized protein
MTIGPFAAWVLASGIATAQAPSPFAGVPLRTIGPATMSGRITDIAVNESNPYEFYAASATGGVWKTTDNGVTWVPVFEREATHSVGAIAVDQRDPNVVWVGTGEATNRQSSSWGDGVYKSTDGGRTWRNMGLREGHHIARIAIDPTNSDVVYVAVPGHLWGPTPERGLYKTTDGGRTWELVLRKDDDTGAVDVAIDPSDPGIVYAAMYQRRRQPFGFVGGGPGSALFKSTDAGRTWKRLSSGLPPGTSGRIGISIYRKDPRVVYISLEQGSRYTSSISYARRLGGVYRSDDRGESWRHMSDWNPRPAYSSQIRVDPGDQSRIYMVAFSFSDDSGKTFREPRQTLHGDDRVVWVNPKDSRHLIKGDDGGVGISYDRGLKWLYVTTLPVSQFYRISVGTGTPYLVCGGLQDNGSWCAPNETWTREGVRNEDWFRVGGGDGFFNVVDTTDNRTVYSSSQYLGITRVDLRTLEAKNLRPTPREGEGPKLGNWGAPDPRVGRKIPPAGWNSPFIISPHDAGTICGGMAIVLCSRDRGETWASLGNLTTGVDRRTLPIMGQLPREDTPSLDDGVSYYPTTSALAESPRVRGLLYGGTDDGNLKVTRDNGRTWTDLTGRAPGVPRGTWVSAIEPSRHADGTVYVAWDGHQADDYTNYLQVSTDFGRTFTSITGDMPPNRVIHSVHEDLRNPRVLYAGTEFGLFVTTDGGGHWWPLQDNLPNVPVNEFTIQPRENDLVLGTHGRGIWILDQVNFIQEFTPEVRAKASHLFTLNPASMLRLASSGGHVGDMHFRGENPPYGAIIDLWARDGVPAGTTVSIHESRGREVARVPVPAATGRGVRRVTWNLRLPPLRAAAGAGGDEDGPGGSLPGRFVAPGTYLARLTLGGESSEQRFEVREDPRVDLSAQQRAGWHASLDRIAALYRSATSMSDSAGNERRRLAGLPEAERTRLAGRVAEADDLALTSSELVQRIATLYGNVIRFTGPPTTDQRAQLEYFPTVLEQVTRRWRALGVVQ